MKETTNTYDVYIDGYYKKYMIDSKTFDITTVKEEAETDKNLRNTLEELKLEDLI